MKILIVSGTHGENENLKQVIARTRHPDMLIHLGDAEGSEYVITSRVNEDCDFQMTLGSNSFFSDLEREKDITIGGHRTFLIHGHYCNVSVSAKYPAEEARARGFDIAMFGHTHRPFYEVDRRPGDEDLIVLNPGSLSYPCQDGYKPSYMLMEIDKEGKTHFPLNPL